MEVISITQKLIELGFTTQENLPDRDGSTISWKGITDLSVALKSISYKDKFRIISESDNFNFRFVDGAFVQMLYTFDHTGKSLKGHRLVYFPAPNLERYDENPEDYNHLYFGSSEFHDMIEDNVVTVPVRFDFSDDEDQFENRLHPYSHFTIGEFKNCRIPVSRPVTPFKFINFILHSFYKNVVLEYADNHYFENGVAFEDCITESEREEIFIDP